MPKIERKKLVCVGRGFGGMGVLYHASEEWDVAAKDMVILEKGETGGVWFWNQFLGRKCDVPGIIYCFKDDIDAVTELFPDGNHTEEFLRTFPERKGLDTSCLRSNTNVYALHYNDSTGEWTVKTKDVGPDGEETEGTTYIANFVILASGQLDKPKIPDIPGQDLFKGEAFYTARWNHEVELAGKKIAVVGTGSSAIQVIPELAKKEGVDVTVY